MRYVTVLAGIALGLSAGCGAKPRAIENSPGPRPGVTSRSTGAEIVLERDTYVDEAVIEASVEDAWRALPVAWADATLPVSSANNATHTLQSGTVRTRDKIVGKPLSDFFDCGYTMAGPRVLLWQVSMEVASAIVPDPKGSRIGTRVTATARPRDGSSTSPVNCTSRGELERIIAGNLRIRLGG